MKKYIFKTTATMKPYNNKNWWIDGGIIPVKHIEAEMEELKQSYFYQLQDENPEILQGITEAEQTPDDIIQEHYNGVEFVNDDFFCNMEG